MIKLSRTGWNNVVIFAVMGFILLINMTQKNKFTELASEPNAQQQRLIGEHNVIVSLTVNQQTNIERIGQTWRSIPAVLSGQPLSAMMKAWHDVNAIQIDKPAIVDKSQSLIVTIDFAGRNSSEYFILMPRASELVIFHQSSQQWFSVPLPMFDQLIPKEVIL